MKICLDKIATTLDLRINATKNVVFMVSATVKKVSENSDVLDMREGHFPIRSALESIIHIWSHIIYTLFLQKRAKRFNNCAVLSDGLVKVRETSILAFCMVFSMPR